MFMMLDVAGGSHVMTKNQIIKVVTVCKRGTTILQQVLFYFWSSRMNIFPEIDLAVSLAKFIILS